MDQSLNLANRPRRGVLAALGLSATAALVGGAIVIAAPSAVEASGLARFTSCAEMREWGEDAMYRESYQFDEVGAAIADVDSAVAADSAAAAESSAGSSPTGGGADGAAPPAAPGPLSTTVPAMEERQAEGQDDQDDQARTDGDVENADEITDAEGDSTNVIVEGIDEPDLVERLGGDRALVVGGQTLAVADLSSASVEVSTRVPWGAQITYDAVAGIAWSVGYGDRGETLVQRFQVSDGSLAEVGSWSTSGQLVSARRQGGELLVVATEWFSEPTAGSVGSAIDGGGDVGVEEPGWVGPDGGGTSGIPFEDGPVPCDQVLHPEGPAEPSSTLLVVLPVEGPLEPVRATQVVGSGTNVHVTGNAAYLATPSWDPAGGDQTTGLHRFDLASLTHTGSGAVDGSLLNDFAISEHGGHLRVAVTIGGGGFVGIPMPVEGDGGIGDTPVGAVSSVGPAADPVLDGPAESPMVDEPMPMPTVVDPGPAVDVVAINEIVVLDTAGDLDVVGRTPRFGHPGETLHGIRFAVTFLQTDPFYVIDLADPANPAILGELELPGFSAYLHPISATQVVGFGPDESGLASAKLFDVSDRTNPRVVDSIVLGDESPVVWDHHAFTSLGDGRFAVPANDWGYMTMECFDDICSDVARPGGMTNSSLVVVQVSGDRLVEEDRITVQVPDSVLRVIPASDGWGLLGSTSLTVVDLAGATRGTITLD